MKSIKIITATLFLVICKPTDGLDLKEFLDGPITIQTAVPQVLEYLQHPVGIPILNVPNELTLDETIPIEIVTINITSCTIIGHQNLTLDFVKIDLTELSVEISIKTPNLSITGDYDTSSSWNPFYGYTYYNDKFQVSFDDFDFRPKILFGVNPDTGVLEAKDLIFNLQKKNFVMKFENIYTYNKVSYGLLAVADSFLDTLLGLVDDAVLAIINRRLSEKTKDLIFPTDLRPLDFLIAKYRPKIDDLIKKKDFTQINTDLSKYLSLKMENIDIAGLSTIHRTKDISTDYVDSKFFFIIELGTQAIEFNADYELNTFMMMALTLKSGHVRFKVDSIAIRIDLVQTADIQHPPTLRDIQVELGNFGFYTDENGSIDYALEAAINIAPNAFRSSIMKIVQKRLKTKIQEKLSEINLEKMLHDALEKVDKKQQKKDKRGRQSRY